MAGLARDRVVLAPATPGYGGSHGPDAPTTIESYAQIMMALVDGMLAASKLPDGPIDVLGYHTGSVISTELDRSRPDRVRRIGLLGLAAYDTAERARRLAAIDRFPVPRADGSTSSRYGPSSRA